MDLSNAIQNELSNRKTLTTNGAVAYATTGKELLDFNFAISVLRNSTEEEIKNKFAKVFFEDRLLAIKYVFYCGDIRQGLGERKIFRSCFSWLVENQTEIAISLLGFIPEYNRWDSLSMLVLHDNVSKQVVDIIKKQLSSDIKNCEKEKPISLLAKWLQSENASSNETKMIAKKIRKSLKMSPKQYRKTLTKLRKYLDVVEVKMSNKDFGSIDYESVPSKANLIYKEAFMRNDKDRRLEYLQGLKNGTTKINSSVTNPHEILTKYKSSLNGTEDTYEALWKNLPNLMTEDTLCVRDGSGSMTWSSVGNSTPYDIATALSIYTSEHNTGQWKNKVITFSSNPEIIDFKNCKSLWDKIKLCDTYRDCSNTDIYKTMKLILNAAVKAKLSQEDMPKQIVIMSDMQFDGNHPDRFGYNKSLFDSISEEYKEKGFKLPKIVFWNLSFDHSGTIPMKENELGLLLVSGFSVQILRMFMSNKLDPYLALVDTLNSERYEKIKLYN